MISISSTQFLVALVFSFFTLQAQLGSLAFLHCRHFIDSAFVFVGCDPRLIPEGGDLVLEGDGNAEAYGEGRGLETGADLILIESDEFQLIQYSVQYYKYYRFHSYPFVNQTVADSM